jgi:hypothetical protein
MRARRRSIRFNGKEVTISAAVKDGLLGGDKRHTFRVSQIKDIKNTPPGFSRPGRLVFTVEGASTDVLENPAGGGDKVDMNTFCYGSLESGAVRKLVAEIEQAMDRK